MLNLSLYLFWAVALLDIFETKFSYNDFVFKFLKLFSFLQFIGRNSWDCMMCIQRDGGFIIF